MIYKGITTELLAYIAKSDSRNPSERGFTCQNSSDNHWRNLRTTIDHLYPLDSVAKTKSTDLSTCNIDEHGHSYSLMNFLDFLWTPSALHLEDSGIMIYSRDSIARVLVDSKVAHDSFSRAVPRSENYIPWYLWNDKRLIIVGACDSGDPIALSMINHSIQFIEFESYVHFLGDCKALPAGKNVRYKNIKYIKVFSNFYKLFQAIYQRSYLPKGFYSAQHALIAQWRP